MTLENTIKRQSLVRKVLGNPVGFLVSSVLLVIFTAGILARWITPFDPLQTDIYNILAEPGVGGHALGTDSAGRDVLSRIIFGTQLTLSGAALTLLIAMVVGVTSGLLAGYFGSWFGAVSNWTTGLTMSLPGLVVLLSAAAVLGPATWIAMSIFGILLSPAYYRLVFTTVRAVRAELFVDAAKVSGLGDARIIGRHILGAVRAPIIIQSGILASIAIGIQAGLELLGLGDSEGASWGSLLNDGFGNLFNAPLLILWPSLIIGMTTLSLALLANTIRDELERTGPKSKKIKGSGKTTSQLAEDRSAEDAIIHESSRRDNSNPLLTISNLAIGYPNGLGGIKQVVHDVNLTVNRGEVVGLIGESGSGKTQTAFAVLGLLPSGGRVISGSILFEGQELAAASSKVFNKIRGGKISYIPQEPMSNLDPTFTIGTQLVEPMMQVLGISKKQARAKAIDLLNRVGIPNPVLTMKKYPHEVSGGQAQRVLIAGAVSCEPDLIIADEPTTALDVTVQAEVLDLLRDLQREMNTALLLVTHNFGVVADICDYINVMKNGRIVEAGPVVDIFENAKHSYTKSLLSSILEGGPARGAYTTPKGNK